MQKDIATMFKSEGVFYSKYGTQLFFLIFTALLTSFPAHSSEIRYLNNQWSEEERIKFYTIPQGSKLIPYTWFSSLEQAAEKKLFASPENLESYGWLFGNDDGGTLDPKTLPIGFTVNTGDDGISWLGINCAACHTSELAYNGVRFRVDGGAADMEFDRFIGELGNAVSETITNENKLNRFMERLSNISDEGAEIPDIERFKEQAGQFSKQMEGRQSAVPSGPARMDAFGQIVNAAASTQLGEDDNYKKPSAPVSIPHVWLSPHTTWVQWNASAPTALVRNVAQVLGVFGTAELEVDKHDAFESSALIPELVELENLISRLRAPEWDEHVFGNINHELGYLGKVLFDQDCRGCHNMPPYSGNGTTIDVTAWHYKDIGTDPVYVEDSANRVVSPGSLAELFSGDETTVPASEFLTKVVKKILSRASQTANQEDAAIPFQQLNYEASERTLDPSDTHGDFETLRAGPLEGVWATGPYFHNGSVRTLYDVLSLATERERTFYVGSRELDPKYLGFRSDSSDKKFLYDTSKHGNSNKGHEYPPRGYTEREKFEVLEYLKAPLMFVKPPTREID